MSMPYIIAEIERRKPSGAKKRLHLRVRLGVRTGVSGYLVNSKTGYLEMESDAGATVFVPHDKILAVVPTWL